MMEPAEEKRPESLKEKRPSAFWPAMVAIALLAACAVCVWLLYKRNSEIAELAAARQAEYEKLNNEAEALRRLLRLSPCEAREQYRGAGKPEAAAPVKVAETAGSAPNRPKSPASGPVGAPAAKIEQKPETVETAQSGNAASSAIANIENACVFIISLNNKQLGMGTGFFIAPGYLLTNRHVAGSGGKIFVTSKALGQPVVGRVKATGQGKHQDYALVAVDVPQNSRVTCLPLATEVSRTEKVGAWGFPHLVNRSDPAFMRLARGDFSSVPELSYSEGVVSAVLPRTPSFIIHTAPISPGNSGGPLLNAGGQVVGINTMIALDEDSYRQASIALSASDLLKFLKSNGIEAR